MNYVKTGAKLGMAMSMLSCGTAKDAKITDTVKCGVVGGMGGAMVGGAIGMLANSTKKLKKSVKTKKGSLMELM